MILNLLQVEKDQLKIAFLKYLFLSLIRRIGIILHDKFILTGFKYYLLSAETAFMLLTNAAVFAGAYLATLWYCHGKYVRCTELLYDMGHRYESIYPQLLLKNIEPICDYITFSRNIEFQTVELYRANNLIPKDLQHNVKSCTHAEFLMQSKSYLQFLDVMCFCETNHFGGAGVYFLAYMSYMFFQELFNSEEFDRLPDVTQQNSKRLLQLP